MATQTLIHEETYRGLTFFVCEEGPNYFLSYIQQLKHTEFFEFFKIIGKCHFGYSYHREFDSITPYASLVKDINTNNIKVHGHVWNNNSKQFSKEYIIQQMKYAIDTITKHQIIKEL